MPTQNVFSAKDIAELLDFFDDAKMKHYFLPVLTGRVMKFTKIASVAIFSVLLLSFWQSWAHSTRGGEALSGQECGCSARFCWRCT
ncbi:MAG: hypothetical protein ACSLEN_07115 [Candidatus Malihini olakiniferum]